MCGIYTEVFKKKEDLNFPKCIKILNGLKKRGPDWSFYKLIENIFFGQTVLSMSGAKKKTSLTIYLNQEDFFFYYLTGKYIIINI